MAHSSTIQSWPPHSDHVFATKHGVSISLRVWPATTTSLTPAPYVLWTHGGAYVFGLFTDVISWVVPAFTSRGYHVVSADYRLTPVANIEHMIEDATDARDWCRANLPLLLGAGNVDINRYIVGGDSAGGCISTLLGHKLTNPSPRAVIDDHGLVDLADKQYDNVGRIIPFSGKFAPEVVEAAVADRDLSHAVVEVPQGAAFETLGIDGMRKEFSRPDFEMTDKKWLQLDCRVALYAKSGWVRSALHSERFKSEEEFIEYAKAWSSYHLLDGKTTYPPTYFIHGEADPTVPVAHPRKMAQKLREMGVDVAEYYEAGQDHVFDKRFTGPDVEGWNECVVACLDFMDRHVKN